MVNNENFYVNRLFNVYSEKFTGLSYAGNVYDTGFLCPTLLTFPGGGVPMIVLIGDCGNEYDTKCGLH